MVLKDTRPEKQKLGKFLKKMHKADFKFTERLVELAKIAEIRLLDHLVLGDSSFASIRAISTSLFGR